MISSMFKRDLTAFEAEGLKLSAEDVVRLNALALKVRLSATAPRDFHLPRLVFMPRDSAWRRPLVLREPSVAHELWIEEVLRFSDGESDLAALFVHAYALSRRAEDLPDAFDPRVCARAVSRFAAKRLVRFTREQLSAAVEFCLVGADWTAGEMGGAAKRRGESEGYPETAGEPSPTIGVLAGAKALRIPLTLDDARHLTASEVAEVVKAALASDGALDRDAAKADALGAYCRARDEIRARLRDATETGRSGGKGQGQAQWR